MMGTVYLLHFSEPISNRHTTQHYLGYTSRSVKARINEHQQGQGARLCEVALERGITFEVVRKWTNATRTNEKHLKSQKNSPRLCPVCRKEL